jgi:uncharacterized damage-inducible protein DinB
MSARAEEVARRFEQGNGELMTVVKSCSPEQWRKTCLGEQWSVGVTAHHVAAAYAPIAGMVQALAPGQTVQLPSLEMIDAGNAEHARQFASCTKEETIHLLQSGGQALARAVRGLSDAQLDSGEVLMGAQRIGAAQLVEMGVIGHPTSHLESIRAAL